MEKSTKKKISPVTLDDTRCVSVPLNLPTVRFRGWLSSTRPPTWRGLSSHATRRMTNATLRALINSLVAPVNTEEQAMAYRALQTFAAPHEIINDRGTYRLTPAKRESKRLYRMIYTMQDAGLLIFCDVTPSYWTLADRPLSYEQHLGAVKLASGYYIISR